MARTQPSTIASLGHLPPGTSKWNRIEHRLFAFIAQNWRGKPLLTHEVIVQLISASKTSKGFTVQCRLDRNAHDKGITVSDVEMAKLNVEPADFHGSGAIRPHPERLTIEAIV
jgi:hypothetical protein